MAATAAYVRITRIALGSVPGEAVTFDNISATTAAFHLFGGQYGVLVKASTYGTVTLQVLAEDGTTWLTALTAFSADGVSLGNLPDGMYRVALA